MKKYNDKELADYLLEMRHHDGRAPSWKKKEPWRLVAFWLFIVLLSGLGALARSWGFFGLVSGLALGIIFRDGTHREQAQAIWPFYGKIIDWLKVERISNGEPSA